MKSEQWIRDKLHEYETIYGENNDQWVLDGIGLLEEILELEEKVQ